MRQWARIYRWTARGLSLLVFAVVLMFVVGETAAQPGAWPVGGEWLGLLFFPVGLVGGLLLGWRREKLGSWLAIASVVAFYLWNYLRSGSFPRGPWIIFLAIPALFYLLAAGLETPAELDEAHLAIER